MMKSLFSIVLAGLLIGSCTANTPVKSAAEGTLAEPTAAETTADSGEDSGVTAVSAEAGSAGNVTFSVTIASDETGCDQYANWWEVITEDGTLLYRRILAHSHVNEQPFTRSGGGPLDLNEDATVIVRAHMHPTGYLSQSMKGTLSDGFESVTLPTDFALGLAETEPLPTGCAF